LAAAVSLAALDNAVVLVELVEYDFQLRPSSPRRSRSGSVADEWLRPSIGRLFGAHAPYFLEGTLKAIIKGGIVLLVIGLPCRAFATPRALPFTYPYETLDEGELELELYGDLTPLRVDTATGRLWEPAYQLQNEFEYGLSDRVELGFYQVFEAKPESVDGGTNSMIFDGFKWRVRGRLAEAGQWPVDVGLYLELETLHDETSLEEKVILAKRFGRWHWMANLWVEENEQRPFDATRSFHFIVNPTTGLTFQVSPVFQPGIEYWARGEFGTVGDSPVDVINNRIHHFVGPTVHFDFGKLWWTAGIYADLNNVNKPQPGEIYGSCWARSVLGLNL
jgi:hypothetical protein